MKAKLTISAMSGVVAELVWDDLHNVARIASCTSSLREELTALIRDGLNEWIPDGQPGSFARHRHTCSTKPEFLRRLQEYYTKQHPGLSLELVEDSHG